MNRTIILLLVFVLLGAGAYFLLQNQDTKSTTSKRTDGDFAIENIDEVYKVFIADRKDYQVLLERKDGYWLYNNKYRAKASAISDLLNTIEKVKMKYTTPRAAEKPMIRNLATTGIKVEVMDKNDKVLKAYYVGGTTANGLGTYMIMEGASEPFVTHIPGFQGMIKGKFFKQEDDWKELLMFGESVEEIKTVSVEYPKQRNKSFILNREGSEFTVKPFFEAVPVINKPVLQAAVEKYLTGFSLMHAEAFQNALPDRDSIAQSVPFVILSLTNTKGETETAKLFPIIVKDEFGNPLNYKDSGLKSSQSVARYFVDYSDGSFRMVQHQVFQRIFWSYDYFFKS